ncbi:uncharacterized protein LOC135398743 [Ornithodoros turicata]|uniref:uncharacterized protein LOC135398743 n=1 Tax=Ornithodoros turicata TaxID=34597 RepID=UPI0031386E51
MIAMRSLLLLCLLCGCYSSDDLFMRRVEHCYKNILTYRDTPHALRGRHPIITGKMGVLLKSMNPENIEAKMRRFRSYGRNLRKDFDRELDQCVKDPCTDSPAMGNCLQRVDMFYFDSVAKTCRPFAYTGCRRSYNLFINPADCMAVCADWDQ